MTGVENQIISKTRKTVREILETARRKADDVFRIEIAEYAVSLATLLGEQIAGGAGSPHVRLEVPASWASSPLDTMAELSQMMTQITLTQVEYTKRGNMARIEVVKTEWYAHTCTPAELLAAVEAANTSGLHVRLPAGLRQQASA